MPKTFEIECNGEATEHEVGVQIHDLRDSYGYVITEINILPLTFLLRFGDGKVGEWR
ncbi:hypothetical protein [Brevibacillus laterosporus]|uniref:Uncharacterized protein n=1 Tax=Brevibacillus laterosporus TaxID=1465 RepID=A0AAP3GBH2_BRELA|nr:hypothetical protein [Brevibacillus laterosporus]MCR8980912.1 hypothetical protein [Brevibacillus laterosporus]MCZ0808067.1 hypothetical protein [Brevibacillus laterosporus]MCZ0826259.1 hypothetical protein [Brevibacillus laterosporus]MCZ0850142.1 hypothetical protein [Brevibacillus laterosporus]